MVMNSINIHNSIQGKDIKIALPHSESNKLGYCPVFGVHVGLKLNSPILPRLPLYTRSMPKFMHE